MKEILSEKSSLQNEDFNQGMSTKNGIYHRTPFPQTYTSNTITKLQYTGDTEKVLKASRWGDKNITYERSGNHGTVLYNLTVDTRKQYSRAFKILNENNF